MELHTKILDRTQFFQSSDRCARDSELILGTRMNLSHHICHAREVEYGAYCRTGNETATLGRDDFNCRRCVLRRNLMRNRTRLRAGDSEEMLLCVPSRLIDSER